MARADRRANAALGYAAGERAITGLIFVAAYAALAVGGVPWLRVDRTGVAIVGAVLMVATGAIGFDDAARAVDFRTLVCLVYTPLVLDVCAARRLRPLPFLLALATASNIGSAATITGAPWRAT